MNFVSAIAAVIAAFFSAAVYILMTRKTTIVLTFNNGKDTIGYDMGEKPELGFFLKNTGKVSAYNVEAVVYFPKGVSCQLGVNPEEAEYFDKPDRVVLRINTLPPKSSPKQIVTRWGVKFLSKPKKYEFRYEITGEKVKASKGRLIVQTK